MPPDYHGLPTVCPLYRLTALQHDNHSGMRKRTTTYTDVDVGRPEALTGLACAG